jgi:hypothetical protein
VRAFSAHISLTQGHFHFGLRYTLIWYLSWLDKTKKKFELLLYSFLLWFVHVVGSRKAVYHIQHTMVSLSPFYSSDLFIFVTSFCHFVKNVLKKMYFTKISLFLNFFKNHHNFLQYERVLNIFYFHILNIAKFDEILFQLISTWATSKNWKKKIFKKIITPSSP